MTKQPIKPMAATVGVAFAASMALAPAALANQNPFQADQLSSGYNLASKDAEGKCGGDKAEGEGKCGEGKQGEGKCGEGKCGGDKADNEGKCGAEDRSDDKAACEGKCGEGKCGGAS